MALDRHDDVYVVSISYSIVAFYFCIVLVFRVALPSLWREMGFSVLFRGLSRDGVGGSVA